MLKIGYLHNFLLTILHVLTATLQKDRVCDLLSFTYSNAHAMIDSTTCCYGDKAIEGGKAAHREWCRLDSYECSNHTLYFILL